VNIQLEDINETRKNVTVSIEAKEIDQEQKRIIGQFSSQARIPGFRPGKAPAKMILSKYGKAVEDELRQKVVSKAYEKVVQDSGVKVFRVVELADAEIDAGKDAELKFTVDIEPEITLPEYKGIKVEVPEAEVTEEQIDETIHSVLSQRAEFKEKDEAAEAGDYVRLAYEGSLDGKPLSETLENQPLFTKQASTWEEAGTDRADFPGLAAELVGLKAGDKKDITVTFPEDFRVEELKGKSVEYAVEVSEVRAKILPELNEEFLKSIQVESEEQLRENVKSDLENRQKQEASRIKREQVVNFLVDNSEFPLPESAVENETARIVHNMKDMAQQQGQEAPSEDVLKEDASKEATRRVKVNLILHKIAEEEKVQPEEQDFQRMIMQEAMYSRQKPEKIANDLRKDQARLRSMHESILINKTLELLVEATTVES